MNVLVYSGPEILQISLNHALASLRSVLLPHYTVQPISQAALTNQPWKASCALLVLPQSRDANREGFVSSTSKDIREFVEGGGKCLIFSTSAYLKSRSGGLGLAAGMKGLSFGLGGGDAGPLALPLKFYDKGNDCYVTFSRDEGDLEVKEETTDSKPHITTLTSSDGTILKGIYATDSRELSGFGGLKGSYVSALFQPQGTEISTLIAGLNLDIGEGKLALWAPSVEYPLSEEPASLLLSSFSSGDIRTLDQARKLLLKRSLVQLGLHLPEDTSSSSANRGNLARPLPQFLLSTPRRPKIVNVVLDAIGQGVTPRQSGEELTKLKDTNDEFHFHTFGSKESEELLNSSGNGALAHTSDDPSTWQPKYIVVCRNGVIPGQKTTPLFDLEDYFRALDRARESEELRSNDEGTWGVGEALLYGEAVTSTQTMFDKNPILLSNLPTPFLSIASHQLAGRGRGANIWLSPSGCLQFSLLLRVPLSSTPTTTAFPPSKLVFIQYIFALAVVEACRDESVLGENLGSRVRLKWPNDLYADVGALRGNKDLRKIGGVLVNTSFQGGKVDIVVGCGLNVLNMPPITSLLQLQKIYGGTEGSALSMERTAATIMAKFEKMWGVFLEGRSFEPFMGLYLKRWLHSNQLVTLTTTNPHTKVRIVGITAEHGLLRTVPERRDVFGPGSGYGSYSGGGGKKYIDLQPDGNSFDLMAGLIRTKGG